MLQTIALSPQDSSSLDWSIDYQLECERPPEIRLGTRRIPTWWQSVAPRLAELAAVPAYDPRGVRPINVDDLLEALNFLARVARDDTIPPWIGLLSSGGLQMTWQQGDVEVEAIFDRGRDERIVLVTVGENEWEAPTQEADSLFGTVVDRLSSTYDKSAA
jgi:hypothetical protein